MRIWQHWKKCGRIQEYYIFYRLISLKSAVNFTALLLSTSDGMFKFVFKRILMVIPTFIAITFITFALVHFIPGDPVEIMMGNVA